MSEEKIRVILVDDEPLALRGLKDAPVDEANLRGIYEELRRRQLKGKIFFLLKHQALVAKAEQDLRDMVTTLVSNGEMYRRGRVVVSRR